MKKLLKGLTLTFMVVLVLSLCMTAGAADKGISVVMDGETLTFTDAAPRLENGRVMLPFRAIFEAIGFEAAFDAETGTVSASRDGAKVSFVVGQKAVSVTRGEVTETVVMDVAPYIDDSMGRTYVPVRFAAESMGYTVGWDEAAQAVILIDGEKLEKLVNEKFSVLNLLLQNPYDMEKTYASTGTLEGNIAIDKELSGKAVSIGMKGTMEAISKGRDAQVDMNLKMDFASALAALTEEMEPMEAAMIKGMLSSFEDIIYDIRLDGETGIMYMNNNAVNTMMGMEDNAWLKMDIAKLYSDMFNIDIMGLIEMSYSGELTVGSLVPMFLSMGGDYLTVDAYSEIMKVLDAVDALIGDGAFTTTRSGLYTEYRRTITGDMLGEYMDDMSGADIAAEIYIRERNGELVEYTFDIAIKMDEMEMAINASQSGLVSSKTKMTMSAPGLFSMDFVVSASTSEAIGAPETAPPSGAVIIDYFDLFPDLIGVSTLENEIRSADLAA